VKFALEHHIEHASLFSRPLGSQKFSIVVRPSDPSREEAPNFLRREFAEERQLPETLRLEARQSGARTHRDSPSVARMSVRQIGLQPVFSSVDEKYKQCRNK